MASEDQLSGTDKVQPLPLDFYLQQPQPKLQLQKKQRRLCSLPVQLPETLGNDPTAACSSFPLPCTGGLPHRQLQDLTFISREALEKFASELAASHGCLLRVRSSHRDRDVLLCCVNPICQSELPCVAASSEAVTKTAAARTTYQQTQCPFSIYGLKRSSQWMIYIKNCAYACQFKTMAMLAESHIIPSEIDALTPADTSDSLQDSICVAGYGSRQVKSNGNHVVDSEAAGHNMAKDNLQFPSESTGRSSTLFKNATRSSLLGNTNTEITAVNPRSMTEGCNVGGISSTTASLISHEQSLLDLRSSSVWPLLSSDEHLAAAVDMADSMHLAHQQQQSQSNLQNNSSMATLVPSLFSANDAVVQIFRHLGPTLTYMVAAQQQLLHSSQLNEHMISQPSYHFQQHGISLPFSQPPLHRSAWSLPPQIPSSHLDFEPKQTTPENGRSPNEIHNQRTVLSLQEPPLPAKQTDELNQLCYIQNAVKPRPLAPRPSVTPVAPAFIPLPRISKCKGSAIPPLESLDQLGSFTHKRRLAKCKRCFSSSCPGSRKGSYECQFRKVARRRVIAPAPATTTTSLGTSLSPEYLTSRKSRQVLSNIPQYRFDE
ncbi:hypothetical protein BASA81_008757 [Batrachochytrium salamandrivorans]|nr:hypothetical protein BASA81_008757 [Batrachochytrium salamandrivorans]